MAFSTGQVSIEGTPIKRYTGVASVFVLGVNPTKEELEKIYGRELEFAPEYVGDTEIGEEGSQRKVPQVRLDFIVKADPDKYKGDDGAPLNFISKVSLFLTKEYRYNKKHTKVQAIDKYGNTAWIDIEDAKKHIIPMYSNGPANIDKGYRPAYIGEEELVKFLIAYLNIPSPFKYVKEENKYTWQDADKLADAEAGLEHIEDYFKGDFSELRNIIGYQPKNKVKVLFGVKTTADNKQYQTVYTRMFLKNGISDYSKLDADVRSTKEAGALSTSEFDCTDLHEYVVEETSFNTPSSSPFPPQGANPWGQNN